MGRPQITAAPSSVSPMEEPLRLLLPLNLPLLKGASPAPKSIYLHRNKTKSLSGGIAERTQPALLLAVCSLCGGNIPPQGITPGNTNISKVGFSQSGRKNYNFRVFSMGQTVPRSIRTETSNWPCETLPKPLMMSTSRPKK